MKSITSEVKKAKVMQMGATELVPGNNIEVFFSGSGRSLNGYVVEVEADRIKVCCTQDTSFGWHSTQDLRFKFIKARPAIKSKYFYDKELDITYYIPKEKSINVKVYAGNIDSRSPLSAIREVNLSTLTQASAGAAAAAASSSSTQYPSGSGSGYSANPTLLRSGSAESISSEGRTTTEESAVTTAASPTHIVALEPGHGVATIPAAAAQSSDSAALPVVGSVLLFSASATNAAMTAKTLKDEKKALQKEHSVIKAEQATLEAAQAALEAKNVSLLKRVTEHNNAVDEMRQNMITKYADPSQAHLMSINQSLQTTVDQAKLLAAEASEELIFSADFCRLPPPLIDSALSLTDGLPLDALSAQVNALNKQVNGFLAVINAALGTSDQGFAPSTHTAADYSSSEEHGSSAAQTKPTP